MKEIDVWVKLHNVPFVAYTDDGLSILALKIGKPNMLDTFTVSVCKEAWGRSSFARALIKISADTEFKESIV